MWRKHFGDKYANAVTVQDVERFRRKRETQVSPSTVRKDLVTLSTLFSWAVARGLVRENPADFRRVRRPSEPRHRRGYLIEKQETALLKVSTPWLARVIRWAINTGMDREEVVNLTWGDVDERAGVVFAPRSKTGAPRDIPLNATLRGILGEAKKLRSVAAGNRVFLADDGSALTVEGVKTALRRAYVAAGVSVSGPFKIFRHTFGSRLAMAGHSEQAIAALMGHTTATITDRYMHLSPAHLRDVMASLDGPTAAPVQAKAG
jgi:integrase